MKCILSSHANADDRDTVVQLIQDHGFKVISVSSKTELAETNPLDTEICLFISDRTKFLISEEYIRTAHFMMINTHPSLLPFHKGSLPVFWSTLLGSALGVTLHKIEPGLDSGDIISQQPILYDEGMTFKEVHATARATIVEHINSLLSKVRRGEPVNTHPQVPSISSHHLLKDGNALLSKLPLKWDTTIRDARHILRDSVASYHQYSLLADFSAPHP